MKPQNKSITHLLFKDCVALRDVTRPVHGVHSKGYAQ